MRTWKNLLYFDAMPGRYRPIEDWLSEMNAAEVARIVCLAPQDGIVRRSTTYHLWRKSRTEYEITDVPILDYGVPDAAGTERFRREAVRVAQDIQSGRRVFIHCGAGIGRTGTFACAVLIASGYEANNAMREISPTGSHPETQMQVEPVEALPAEPESQEPRGG